MKRKIIPQFEPYWDDNEIKAVNNVLASDYLNENKTTRKFEEKFAKFVGARYCVTCTNGYTALYLALKAILEKESFRSIYVPDYAGIFVANASKQAGLTIRISDVGKNGSMNKNYKHRYVVHNNGRKGNVSTLEDCAQAINLHTKNALSCYSFASTKHLTTAGQGGAICCDDKYIFDTLCRLKDLGRNSRYKSKPMVDHVKYWGINSKFTEIQAAFGLEQLKKLPWRLKRLRTMYELVKEELSRISKIKFFEQNPYWYIDMLVADPENLIKKLQKKSIQLRRFYKPLHLQPLYKKTRFRNFPNTNYLYEHGVWLPSTTNLTDEDLLFITAEIKNCMV